MAIVPIFSPTPSSDEDRSLEAYVKSFRGDFPAVEYHYILQITKTTHGWILDCAAFQTFCSHKYRRAASPIQQYVHRLIKPQDQTTHCLCVGVDGTFKNGYAVWILAFDDDLPVFAQTEDDPEDPRIHYQIYDALSGNPLSDLDKIHGPSFPQIPGSGKKRTTRKAK